MAVWRIRAVVPCYNRPADLALLLGDLSRLDLGDQGRVDLSVLVVDNASDPPLEDVAAPSSLDVEYLCLPRNSGGSGGFNAGIARTLARGLPGDACEFIWLLDSDARLEPSSLLPLIEALQREPSLAAAGSVLVDPLTGKVFEAGGEVDPQRGEYVQSLPKGWESQPIIRSQYLAACSLLVRRTAVERAGLMADLFLNGDDVEWCLRLVRRTGGWVGAVPASRVIHPNFDRMRTGPRYYAARNAFVAIAAAGGGIRARGMRALREVGRAVSQTLVGRDDLARLHVRGLEDAAAGVRGPAPAGTVVFEAWRDLAELPGALKQILATDRPRGRVMIRRGLLANQAAVSKALNAVCVEPVVLPEERIGEVGSCFRVLRRLVSGLPWGIAVVSARARPGDWLAGRVTVTVVPEGFVVRKLGRRERAARLAGLVWRGVWLAAGLAFRGAPTGAGEQEDLASGVGSEGSPTLALRRPTLSVVLLSCNRWASLEKTLEQLGRDPALAGAQVIVADNGSGDGTVERLRERYPGVELVALAENRGVAGFNEGVRRASGDAVLILDDDACPEPGVLDAALGLLAARPWVGAVALHPRHPATKASEWRFAERASAREDWPVMGCGNLVRREAWDRVGGYEESFFLYRNDVDLALKLLGAGYGVYFDPAWTVWHDSPGAAKKSLRWFELATRNWVWLCRRHGRGAAVAAGALLGWAWAHRLAGRDWRAHAAVLRGVVRGAARRPAPCGTGGGAGLRSLLSLRLGRRARD